MAERFDPIAEGAIPRNKFDPMANGAVLRSGNASQSNTPQEMGVDAWHPMGRNYNMPLVMSPGGVPNAPTPEAANFGLNVGSALIPFGEGASLLPKGASLLSKGIANIAGRIGQSGATSAGIAGLESGGHPVEAGITGGLTQGAIESAFPALKYGFGAASRLMGDSGLIQKLRDLAGLNESKGNIQEAIRQRLTKQSQQTGGIRTPEESGELLQNQYTDVNGKSMPVDIGSLTGDNLAKGAYNATNYTPFSGTPNVMNSIREAQNDKAIQDISEKIKGEQSNIENDKQLALQKRDELVSQSKSYSDTANELKQKISQIADAKDKLQGEISKAPAILDAMHDSRLARSEKEDMEPYTRADIPELHAKDVMSQYDSDYQKARDLYKPLNESNLHVEVSPHGDFDDLRSVTNDLSHDQTRWQTILGTDLNSSVKKALSATKTFLDDGTPFVVSVPDMVTHMQNLGKAAAALRAQGENRAASSITRLDKAMENGFTSSMNKSGESDLANSYKQATSYFKNNVVPYWENSFINKAINGKIPKENTLANALHETQNLPILKKLPIDTQRSLGAEVIGHTQGTSSGSTNQTAEDIAQTYKTGVSKNAKSVISQYAPQEDRYFENLKDKINQYNVAEKSHDETSKTSEKMMNKADKLQEKSSMVKIPESTTSSLESLKKQLQDAIQNKNNLVPESKLGHQLGTAGTVAATAAVSKLLPGIGTLAIAAGKPLAELLRDPKLIESYIKRQPISVQKSLYTKLKELSPRVSGIIGGNTNGS